MRNNNKTSPVKNIVSTTSPVSAEFHSITTPKSNEGNIKLQLEEEGAGDDEQESNALDIKEPSNNTRSGGSWGDLFYFATFQDVVLLIIGTLAAVLAGALWPIFALLIGDAVSAFENDSVNLSTLKDASLNFTYLAIGIGICHMTQHMCFSISSTRQMHTLRMKSLRAILTQNVSWFDLHPDLQQLSTRISGDTVIIQEGIGEKLGEGLKFFSSFISGFAIGFTNDWRLSLVMCASVPFVITSLGWILQIVRTRSVAVASSYAVAGGIAHEVLSSIKTIASFNLEKKSMERYESHVRDARDTTMKSATKLAIAMGSTMSSIAFTYALGLWYGARLVATSEDRTASDVLTVFYGILIGSFALGQASPNLLALGAAKGSAKVIVKLVEDTAATGSDDEIVLIPEEVTGQVEFKSVCFAYPSRPSVNILSDCSLVLEAGTTTAICGQSGSGKSTFASLLQRFYNPKSGTITIDGIDIASLRVNSLRSVIGIVSQEPVVFCGTIAMNIALGSSTPHDPSSVSREEIISAAKQANAHHFIKAFPDGYDTVVGETGSTGLSGGQKQRIAIARAIMKKPRILLLDEATSALDNESERIVQEALNNLTNNNDMILSSSSMTTLVIAHRLSTIKSADKIAVLNSGAFVETGSHAELMSEAITPTGYYRNLVAAQMNDGEEANTNDKTTSTTNTIKTTTKVAAADTAKKNIGNDERHEETKKPVMRRLLKLYNSSTRHSVLSVLSGIVAGGSHPFIGVLLTAYVDAMQTYSGDKLQEEVRIYTYGMIGLGVVMWFSRYVQIYTLNYLSEALTLNLRVQSFNAMLRQEIGWFDNDVNRPGALTERLASDPPAVKAISGESLGRVIMSLSTLAVAVLVAFIYGSWQLTLVLLAILPFMIWSVSASTIHLLGGTPAAKKSLEDASKLASESIAAVRTIKSLGREETILNLYEKKLEPSTSHAVSSGKFLGLVFGLSQFLILGAYGLVFYIGGLLVDSEKISFPQLFRTLIVIMMASQSIGPQASFLANQATAKAAAARIFAIIDREPLIKDETKDDTKVDLAGDIVFENIRFSYPSRTSVEIFKNFSLTIPYGSTVALVGESGSGKSTICALLSRFYQPDDGKITINSCNIRTDVRISDLRKEIGYVGQEPVLFSTTIGENISDGGRSVVDVGDSARMSDVHDTATLANASGFVSSLPEGYDTHVGPRGVQLSGGQKQRIAIARAVIRRPSILLLDEATSALDTESEALVQQAIDRLLHTNRKTTAIVIAHRLSTVRNADKIVVLDKGEIVEIGSHTELMAAKGRYYNLATTSLK